MIEDGTATITIRELDELRDSSDKWNKIYEKKYQDKLAELESREKHWKEMEKIVEEKAGDYLIAKHHPVSGLRIYKWFNKTVAFCAFENDMFSHYYNVVDEYLAKFSMREIRKRKRELK